MLKHEIGAKKSYKRCNKYCLFHCISCPQTHYRPFSMQIAIFCEKVQHLKIISPNYDKNDEDTETKNRKSFEYHEGDIIGGRKLTTNIGYKKFHQIWTPGYMYISYLFIYMLFVSNWRSLLSNCFAILKFIFIFYYFCNRQ